MSLNYTVLVLSAVQILSCGGRFLFIDFHHFSSPSKNGLPVMCGTMAALASGLTLSSLAPHTLLPPLPHGDLFAARLASALNLMLMQSERPLGLLQHPYSASLRLVSNLLPLHSICLASGSKLHFPSLPSPAPLLSPSAPLLLLGCRILSCS